MSYKRTISRIKFGILSPEIIRKLSVAEIQTPDTYDEDGVPIPTGVMDPRLGTLEPGQRCQTCGNTYLGCPGHFGHIELPTPVIHVGFAKTILTLLRATCRSCGRILLTDEEIKDYKEKLKQYEEGGIASRQIYYKIIQKAISMNSCPHCGEKQYKVELEKPTTFKEQTEYGTVKLSPSIVRARLERIPDEDLMLLNIDPKDARPEWMVITVLPVPPVYVRPSITLESGYRSEDDLTHKLVDIIRVAQRLRESISTGSPSPIIAELSDLLQYHVTTYINNEALGISPSRHRSGRILKTLAQRLKGKEGRFRLNLSGKRVDFSSRTVISPDPNLSINEVGVPLEVAKQLTVPEKVTSWNIEKMREYVRNGPDKYPGARYIIRPDGKRIRLKYISNLEELANALEPGFIVERHLIDGDIVLFNRQPSLHRMSIMAHLVKVLPYRTFRLNLAVCPPYNADFDGDEMNLHVPQSEEAQVEARFLLLVQNNIISPRYGAPIIGAIRDFLTSAYLLTKKDTLLSKDEVSALCASINYDGELPEPIIKSPEPKWSGKQIFSLLLPKDFNHELESSFEDEKQVIIRNGQLISGVLDRNSIGIEKSNSILHVLAKEYGPAYVKEFLDKLCRLLNTFITLKGFTFSLDDLQIPEKAYEEIKNVLNEMDKEYQEVASTYKDYEKLFESNVLSIVSKARSKAGKIVRSVISPLSSALIMAKTGARGTSLNIDQMIATVGQQSVRRERIKRGFDGRVLPFFMKGDSSIPAKGFVYNSFLRGLDPIEFFFHAAGGRDGLVDTAVRTQQSGYMQRRLINALESLYIEYDGTVRIAEDKRIVQFQYGEDGID
ncbi:MAG: DNA-directed RNA polymerase subunit A', partial [Nitrososphaerota archaeon]